MVTAEGRDLHKLNVAYPIGILHVLAITERNELYKNNVDS